MKTESYHFVIHKTFIFIVLGVLACFSLGSVGFAVQTEDAKAGFPFQNDVKKKEAIKRFEKRRGKQLDMPNPKDQKRFLENHNALNRRIDVLRSQKRAGLEAAPSAVEQKQKEIVTDRVLVILVEFGGTDTFSWDPATSAWDPLGLYNPAEDTGENYGTPEACANIITEPQTFTYTGPLHNQIPVPATAEEDFDGEALVADFNQQHYHDLIFGDGVRIQYTRGDGSVVDEDFTGKSVANFFRDISGGTYQITGEVVDWVQVDHSTWYYGADACPGARSVGRSSFADGAIDGAGSPRTLVIDALEAVKAAHPDFNWAQYDLDKDGIIDRLWIIHAGVGEEEGTVMLSQTDYAESAIWSHSSRLGAAYEIVPGVAADAYIMMPENSGIAVLAHEYGHNLGADDLYAYGDGETSSGFWSIMSDSWTGYPLGFQPSTMDPWHLDGWGWLNPKVIVDPEDVYNVIIGQASNFPGGEDVFRAAKIALENGEAPFAVQPLGNFQWWGNELNQNNSMMTLSNPVVIQGANPKLSFSLAYDIEIAWDFLWIQVSTDEGATWDTLTNANTVCEHDKDWVGSAYGFPDDLCAAGLGGFSGHNPTFPSYEDQTFDLAAYDGQSILIRFWYMTDGGTLEKGPYLDNVRVLNDTETLFFDDAESGDGNWQYSESWQRVGASKVFTHNYYLQWRNVGPDGGYDSALGDARFRYGPVNSGMVIWYNNNLYPDNEVADYMTDFPSIGPKGRMLVVDAHPEPYRDPHFLDLGYQNEAANLHDTLDNNRYNRGSMRDAAFSLLPTVDFSVKWPYAFNPVSFEGRPAVSFFQDSQGYYAGAEYTTGAPTSSNYYWMTREWDGSVTIPSRQSYALKAPGYTAGEFLIYGIQVDQSDGTDSWSYAGFTTLETDGGDGNPSQSNGEYGWRVSILDQTAQKARVAVWNAHHSTPHVVKVVKTGSGNGTVSETAGKLLDCGEFCSAMVKEGRTITLSALAADDSVFAGWSGGNCTGTGDCTLTVEEATTVQAKFVKSRYQIEVTFEEGCAVEFIPSENEQTVVNALSATDACHVTGEGELNFKQKKVGWKLTNAGTENVTIKKITIKWPTENSLLRKIKLGRNLIHWWWHWPPSATIDGFWLGKPKARTIQKDRSKQLTFKFVKQPVP